MMPKTMSEKLQAIRDKMGYVEVFPLDNSFVCRWEKDLDNTGSERKPSLEAAVDAAYDALFPPAPPIEDEYGVWRWMGVAWQGELTGPIIYQKGGNYRIGDDGVAYWFSKEEIDSLIAPDGLLTLNPKLLPPTCNHDYGLAKEA